MSIDFEIFAQKDLNLTAPVGGANWQVVIDGPYTLDDDDIQDDYRAFVGKRRVFYNVHVEGRVSDQEFVAVEGWFREILTTSRSVLIDLQMDRYETKTKSAAIKRMNNPPEETGRMDFYFEGGEAFYEQGFERFLHLLADDLPAALPTKFGHWEPLEGRCAGRDFNQIVEWFHKDPQLFMVAKTPFGHIFPSIKCKKRFEHYHPQHWERAYFQLSSITFDLRPKLFGQTNLFTKTLAFFERLCVELDVVYAAVTEGPLADFHFCWNGLPPSTPHTLCVGKAYRDVWPELDGLGKAIGTHHKVISTDRFNRPPEFPARLRGPSQPPSLEEFPTAEVFPFDYQYAPDRFIW